MNLINPKLLEFAIKMFSFRSSADTLIEEERERGRTLFGEVNQLASKQVFSGVAALVWGAFATPYPDPRTGFHKTSHRRSRQNDRLPV